MTPPFFFIPQPIFKLKVPVEYLSPEARAAEEARQAQEQAAKTQAAIVFWIAVGLIIATVSMGAIWQRRRKSQRLGRG